MSCSFFNIFYPNIDREEKIELIKDNYKNGGFRFWKEKYLTTDENIQWYSKTYQPSPINLSTIIKDYMDGVIPLKKLIGNTTDFTEEEELKLKEFFKLNKWNDLFKTMMKNRKLYGDSYTSVVLKKTKYGMIPILRTLNTEDIKITSSPRETTVMLNGNDIDETIRDPEYDNVEYIFITSKDFLIREEDSTETKLVTKEIKFVYTKGKILPFVNNILDVQNVVSYVSTPLENEVPLIHIQYKQEDDSLYSEIPSESLIDDCIRLDRVETDIAETNHESGSPQMIVIDGNFDKKSEFGAKSIAYLDTSAAARKANKQADVKQLEITNGLKSLYQEMTTTLDSLYSKTNLIPPSLQESFAKSNSGKVVRYFGQDYYNEIKDGYEQIQEATKFIWKILFPNRENEDIRLFIPEDLNASTMYDKAAYIAANVMSLRQLRREAGDSPEEIERFIEEIKEQQTILSGEADQQNTGTSHSQIEGTNVVKPAGEKETVRDNNPDNPSKSIEGIDNRLKTSS